MTGSSWITIEVHGADAGDDERDGGGNGAGSSRCRLLEASVPHTIASLRLPAGRDKGVGARRVPKK